MHRVLLLVEGQTEEEFSKEVLAPHLQPKSIFVAATMIATKRLRGVRVNRGGTGRNYEHIRKDIKALLGDTNATIVSTLIDYVRLPGNFPNIQSCPAGTAAARADWLESKFAEDISGGHRFLPNLIVHEFESLLFSDRKAVSAEFPNSKGDGELEKIEQKYASPEEINDGLDTTPSRRLESIFANYQKPVHGPRIAQRIGLEAIRKRCPRFGKWLQKIEALANL